MARGRILVAEDDRFYIEFYRDVLEGEGFKVEIVHAGTEAIKRLVNEPFDLVIADLVLKGASGLEFLSEIKKTAPSMDVIMVTSMQSIRKAVDALKLGASDYLTKPVDKDELIMSINKILERQVISQEQSKLISENIHYYELLRIQKISLSLLSIVDKEKLLDKILDTIIKEMNSPGGLFFSMDEKSGAYSLVASRGIFETDKEIAELNLRNAAVRKSLEEGYPLLESEDKEQWVPKGSDEGLRLIMPVMCRRDLLGVVKLLARRGDRPYGAFDIELGRHILKAGGMALKNSIKISGMIDRHIHGKPEGTYTPAYFRSFAETRFSVSTRYNRETALVLMRLENYTALVRYFKEKQVDQVIGHICGSILELIRETDLLARLDEDLFGLLVPETDYYGALMLKSRIRTKLSRTSYPIDMKRDVLPRIQIGCSGCPRDGNSFRALRDSAIGRLEEEKNSIFPHLGLGSGKFWNIITRLTDPSTAEMLERKKPDMASRLRSVTMSNPAFNELARSLLRDMDNFCGSRGLIYLGVGKINPDASLFHDTSPGDNCRVSMLALGTRGGSMWNLPHITPVFINDPALAEHRFILGITEDISYALFCRKEDDKLMKGFHSSDHQLVLELIARLQERYLLQRRIG